MKITIAGMRKARRWDRWQGVPATLAAIALALGILAGSLGVAHADSRYVVQPGDTLTGIAARYGVSVDSIVAANNLPNRSTIFAGQTLVIPSSSVAAPQQPSQPSNGTYVVQPGDTLSGIAARFGTTVEALRQANGLSSSTIYSGQRLKIVAPGALPSVPQQPAPTAANTNKPSVLAGKYTVQPGDSLTSVAARFGVTREALAAANGISPSSYLYVGQVISIPGQGQPQQPKPTSPPAPPPPPPPTNTPVVVPPTVQSTTTPIPVQNPSQAEKGKPVRYTVQPGDTLSGVAARFKTTVANLQRLNNLGNTNFIYVGQVLVIVAGDDQNNEPVATATPPPAQPTPPMGKFGPKWVDVDISTQTLTAYEGDTPVYTSRVSTGKAGFPTVEGTYRVYAKYRVTKMEGGQGTPEYYYIPNVPYTLYFYSGYALHGAFWHNSFGQPMSHGCVNLPVDVAKWIFEWAPLSTMVVTHQ